MKFGTRYEVHYGPFGICLIDYKTPNPTKEKPTMTEQPKTPGITHPELRKQWVDDMAKDPNCVWRVRGKGATAWCSYNPGEQPMWYGTHEYSPAPKTKRYYMVMVKHKGVGKSGFALTFTTQEEIKPYLDSFQLDQVGDVVPRDVEQ